MKIKLTLPLFVAFILGLYCTGCDKTDFQSINQFRYKSAIEKVLADDSRFAQEKPPLREDLSPDEALDLYARGISIYVSKAQNFDSSSVPNDFAMAYRNHLRAWQRTGEMYACHPKIGTFWGNFTEGFIRGMLGDATGGAFEKQANIDQWVSQVQIAEGDIETTWNDVENIARQYGVNR